MRNFLKLNIIVTCAVISGCFGGTEGQQSDITLLECDNFFGEAVTLPDYTAYDTATSVIDAQTLSNAISTADPLRVYAGGLPAASATATGPTLTLDTPLISIFDRSFSELTFTATNTAGYRLKAIFIQVVGATDAFLIPVQSYSVTGGGQYTFTIVGPLTGSNTPLIPADLTGLEIQYTGFFVPNTEFSPDLTSDTFVGYDDSARFSEVGVVPVTLTAVGVGVVQVGLSWNKGPETGSGNVDLDLWLTEPDGNLILWSDRISVAAPLGGLADNLDTDNTEGYGPENIYYDTMPPDGEYFAQVNYYAGDQVTNYIGIVSACGETNIYRGTLSTSNGDEGQKGTIARWTNEAGCTLPPSTPFRVSRPEASLQQKSLCNAYYGDVLTIE